MTSAKLLLTLVCAFLIWYVVSGWWVAQQSAEEAKEKNPKAVAAGFTDYKEMDAAAKFGITNGKEWAAKIAKDREAAQAADLARYEATRNPATKMTTENMSWSIGGFGSVALVSLTINNANDFPVKDIGIECRFSGKSGTQLSTINHT